MIKHPKTYTCLLDDSDVDRILDAALDVLAHRGICIQSDQACRALADAGAAVDGDKHIVTIPETLVQSSLAQIPAAFTLHGRNGRHNVTVGDSDMLIVPGYGSAFIAAADGQRRLARLDDFARLAAWAAQSDLIDVTGGLLVEPNDVPLELRPLEITYSLLKYSEKPFMGSVAGGSGARESLDLVRMVFDDLEQRPAVVGLININSPLRLDGSMADALLEYVAAGQPVLLTPGILMGITAPVTAAGALVQAFAELLGVIVLTQVIRPGNCIIIGLGGFGSDLRCGGTAFGRSENALATYAGAQIARRLKIPYRCTAAVTSAKLPDCRSGYERMMTAMAAFNSGVHYCLQAAGILDSINAMSYEQFLIDLEIWSYIKRLSRPIRIDDDTLAVDLMKRNGAPDYLSTEHTVRHMRHEIHTPELLQPETYESWWADEGKDVVARAAQNLSRMPGLVEPPFENGLTKELESYVDHRRRQIQKAR